MSLHKDLKEDFMELASYSDYLKYGNEDCFEISTVKICKGDIVEIGFGRNKIIAKFLGFNRFLFTIALNTSDGEMIIPYKNIKYIKKLKGNNHDKEK